MDRDTGTCPALKPRGPSAQAGTPASCTPPCAHTPEAEACEVATRSEIQVRRASPTLGWGLHRPPCRVPSRGSSDQGSRDTVNPLGSAVWPPLRVTLPATLAVIFQPDELPDPRPPQCPLPAAPLGGVPPTALPRPSVWARPRRPALTGPSPAADTDRPPRRETRGAPQ